MVAKAHSDDEKFDQKRPQSPRETLGRKAREVRKKISWSNCVVKEPEKYRRIFVSDKREDNFSINWSMGAYQRNFLHLDLLSQARPWQDNSRTSSSRLRRQHSCARAQPALKGLQGQRCSDIINTLVQLIRQCGVK